MTELKAAADTECELLECIPMWRDRARLACVANPIGWLAMHGVSCSDYLAKLDELEAVCLKIKASAE